MTDSVDELIAFIHEEVRKWKMTASINKGKQIEETYLEWASKFQAVEKALKAQQEVQAIWDRRLPYEDEAGRMCLTLQDATRLTKLLPQSPEHKEDEHE